MRDDEFYSGHSMSAIVDKYIIYIHCSHKYKGKFSFQPFLQLHFSLYCGVYF